MYRSEAFAILRKLTAEYLKVDEVKVTEKTLLPKQMCLGSFMSEAVKEPKVGCHAERLEGANTIGEFLDCCDFEPMSFWSWLRSFLPASEPRSS